MAKVSIRYVVDDVDVAIDFYCRELGFEEVYAPGAQLRDAPRGELRLVLTAPGGGPGGGQAMSDVTLPKPGGWNRFQFDGLSI